MTEEKKANETANLATALCKAQSVMSGAKKSATNPFFNSNYANLASVFDAIREPFSKNGLSISQTMDILDSGKQVLCTRLLHTSGEFIDSRMLLPEEKNAQKLGSFISYYRRYSLMAICGLPTEEDDGSAASGLVEPKERPKISQKQVQHIKFLINGYDDIRAIFTDSCAEGKIENIYTDEYDMAINWVKNELAKKKEIASE